jgi:hypothetical protein
VRRERALARAHAPVTDDPRTGFETSSECASTGRVRPPDHRARSFSSVGRARSSRAPDGCGSASRAARGDLDVEFHPASLCPGTGAQPEGMSDRAEVDALPPTARSCASLATSTMSSVQRSTTSTRGVSAPRPQVRFRRSSRRRPGRAPPARCRSMALVSYGGSAWCTATAFGRIGFSRGDACGGPASSARSRRRTAARPSPPA